MAEEVQQVAETLQSISVEEVAAREKLEDRDEVRYILLKILVQRVGEPTDGSVGRDASNGRRVQDVGGESENLLRFN